jgi:hypothetical protein
MNVFEDLIVELKEENLLEETVIDHSGHKTNGNGKLFANADLSELAAEFDFEAPSFEDQKTVGNSANGFQPKPKPEVVKRRLSERMSALQFVEYVFTAVEANFTGTSTTPFDDLSIKKAFHMFEQASSDPESDEYFETESALVTRLESWEEALAGRDRLIPGDAIRRYTETANPPLSPQTLFALTRFYRQIGASEITRAKFDFVTTRLFSKFVDGERRDLLCSRAEIVRHLYQRFSEWSGGQYKKDDADDPNIALLVLGFDDFSAEGNRASNLGEMLANNLFERICEFKESAGEMFMIPEVAAASIECNVTLANKIIELASLELQRKNGSTGRSRYAGTDKSILSNAVASNAVARTIDIGSVFNVGVSDNERDSKAAPARTASKPKEKPAVKSKPAKKVAKTGSNLLGINRWLLLVSVLTIVASLGFYVWSEYYSGTEEASTSTVKTVDFEKAELRQYIRVSRLSGSMLHVIVTAGYEELSADAQREYLQKLLQAGETKGYNKVSLVNIKGRDVGYASAEKIETNSK